jgi:hypothetical protein
MKRKTKQRVIAIEEQSVVRHAREMIGHGPACPSSELESSSSF